MTRKEYVVARLVKVAQRRTYLRYPVLAIITCTLAGYHLGRYLYSLRKKAALAAAVCGVVIVCGHNHSLANAARETSVYAGGVEVYAAGTEPETTQSMVETMSWTEKETAIVTEKSVQEDVVTEPESMAEVTEPESTEEATEPESTDEVTEPESTEEATEPESTEEATEPESTEEATEPESTEEATEPESAGEATEPESTEGITEAETAETVLDFGWNLILVNRDNPLSKDYHIETRSIGNGLSVDVRIYEPLMKMLAAGNSQGCSLLVCSAYRPYERQMEIYQSDIAEYQSRGYSYERACELTEKTLSVPGTSEHQAGLAVDIVARTHQVLNSNYASTTEGKWLAAHAHEYGFIIRYPEDKVDITGIDFEPWHFRYVGVEAATEIHELGCCLEEYIEILKERTTQENESTEAAEITDNTSADNTQE